MSENPLHVSFDEESIVDSANEKEFVICRDIIQDKESSLSQLASMDLDQNDTFSFNLFSLHILHPSRGNLCVYVCLYNTLARLIEENGIDKIITHDLEKGYRLVIDDLSDRYEIETEHRDVDFELFSSFSHRLVSISTVVFFIDQLIGMLMRKIEGNSARLQNIPLFFPYPDRYGSMLPIIREVDIISNIVVTPLTISWQIFNPVENWPTNHHTSTLTAFSDWSTMKIQIKELFKLQKEVITNDLEIVRELDQQLQDEWSIYLPQTIEYVCEDVLTRDIRIVLSLYLVENTITRTEPNSIIVGGMNPRDRHALKVGSDIDSELYYIPHSIAYDSEVIPPIPETTHFVAGPADKRVIQQNYSDMMLPDIEPVGRPYLDELVESTAANPEEDTLPKIIIGTQPYKEWMRDQFITDIIDAVSRVGFRGEIIIKPHPSEQTEYYNGLISRIDTPLEIRIESGHIREYVDRSTILITINSNVGLENILLGGYTISYNPFEPFTYKSSYIDGESIPYLRDVSQLQEHLNSLLFNEISNKSQKAFVHDSYSIGGSTEEIAQKIEQAISK